MELKLGSLFDGMGGFPAIAQIYGIELPWASEIEPVPISVTKRHFPDMLHLGDITKINGAEIEPVDIITFGSPCQDLSVAGNQAGLAGERSGLFSEAIRIIEEMRGATNGRYPTFAVWENVPGAFSSNDGMDFRAVLESFTSTKISIPTSGRWAKSGLVRGGEVDVAWRVLDAQHWGVPQRRKRIFLVADFAGQRAAEILFKSESVRGNLAQSGKAWERFTDVAQTSIRSAGFDGKVSPKVKTIGYRLEQSPTILASKIAHVLRMRSECEGGGKGALVSKEKSLTLATNNDQSLFILNNQRDANHILFDAYQHHGYRIAGTCGTLTTEQNNKVRGDTPLVFDSRRNGDGKVVNTLTGDHQNRVTDYTAICLAGNTVGRQPENGGNGQGYQEELAYTLTATDRHAVAFGQADFANFKENDVSTITAQGGFFGGGSETLVLASGKNATGTLMANAGTKMWQGNQEAFSGDYSVIDNGTVRRLTPLECERLQGFPDNWTLLGHDGKQISDAARYKMIGNSLALPCVDYVISGIVEVMMSEIARLG